MSAETDGANVKVASGIPGLDQILNGGFNRSRTYLIQGRSGTGKTTLGISFVLEGLRRGERVLYITLSETEDELHQAARSHGWSLDGIALHDLTSRDSLGGIHAEQTVFPTADVELGEVIEEILRIFRDVRPERMVLDSITQIRLTAESAVRYRRQLLALKRLFNESECTVLLLHSESDEESAAQIYSLVHGIVALERHTPDYGLTRRRLQVSKMRAAQVESGWHDFRIVTGGLEIYPQLARLDFQKYSGMEQLSSGIRALDRMLGGGLERGTSCLIMGQSGTGKSTVAASYVHAAARRGEKSAIFLFDERRETFLSRSHFMQIDLRPYVDNGTVQIRLLNAGDVTPGEFAQMVRDAVENDDAAIILIDSLTGYLNAMLQAQLLLVHIHELLIYLDQRGVLSLVVLTQHGLISDNYSGPFDASYLADTVLLLRRFEALGTVRQAISVLKKRHGDHERTIRELALTSSGIKVGKPLTSFRGVLSGRPEYAGDAGDLLVQHELPPPEAVAGDEV